MPTMPTLKDLFFGDHPLLIQPTLATAIGLNEAIILHQIHYWGRINQDADRNYEDGYYWTYNSYPKWREQFPFWSERTIRRAFEHLVELGLVVTGNYNKLGRDRTKWYRVDYDRLSALTFDTEAGALVETVPDPKTSHLDNMTAPSGQNVQAMRTNWPDDVDKMAAPLPETSAESSPEIKKEINPARSAGKHKLSQKEKDTGEQYETGDPGEAFDRLRGMRAGFFETHSM